MKYESKSLKNTGRRVLVVDDDKDFAESMAMVLEEEGHVVESAYSGEEAIEKFTREDFDITFMDIKLPDKNGVESFLEISKIKPGAKVVMITAYAEEQLLDQAVGNGAWGVLHKPFHMQEMLDKLEELQSGGILIVDDDPSSAKYIRDLLIKNDRRVFVARDGKEAVERVRSNSIDAIIIDLWIPVLSGVAIYLEMKKISRNIPTLILTTDIDQETRAINTMHSMSISGIFKKPFDPQDLFEILDGLKV